MSSSHQTLLFLRFARSAATKEPRLGRKAPQPTAGQRSGPGAAPLAKASTKVEHVLPLLTWETHRPVPELKRYTTDTARHSFSFVVSPRRAWGRVRSLFSSPTPWEILLLELRRLVSKVPRRSRSLLSLHLFDSPLSLHFPLHHSLVSLRFPLLLYSAYTPPPSVVFSERKYNNNRSPDNMRRTNERPVYHAACEDEYRPKVCRNRSRHV